MSLCRFTISTHGFKVDRVNDYSVRDALNDYLRQCLQFGLVRQGRKFIRKPTKVFAASNTDRTYYRFHIAELEKVKEIFSKYGVYERDIEIVHKPIYEPRSVSLPVREGWVPRDYQMPCIEYVVSSENGPWGKLVALSTGLGKSAVSMFAMSEVGTLPIFILRPAYMDKWAKELLATYDIEKEDLEVIIGNDKLTKMIRKQARGEFSAQVILMSNKTYQAWVSGYEKTNEKDFLKRYQGCTPENFFEFMQIGFRVIDEVHQDFHFNYKMDCYANVPNSVSLSATLVTKDPFINSRQRLAYPPDRTYSQQKVNRYIDVSAYLYQFAEPEKIRVSEYGSKSYSHIAFEQSILKNPIIKMNYFEMIAHIVRTDFFDIRDEGEKFIVFCSRVEMCYEVCEYLKEIFPGEDIRTFVTNPATGEKDPYENLIDSVGRVTTIGSAGTAQDIPMLRTNLLTVALDSISSNLQVLGRTRVMKSGNTPRFIYLTSESIDKHMQYHINKQALLRDRAKTISVRAHDKVI